jgi:hypothetical protein
MNEEENSTGDSAGMMGLSRYIVWNGILVKKKKNLLKLTK